MGQVVVDARGGGDFRSVQQAVELAPGPDEPLRILVRDGVYEEKISIPAGRPVHVLGESAAGTVLTWSDYARQIHPDGREFGTFRTASLAVHADGVRLENLTVANAAGPGQVVGQAVALAVHGRDFTCERVRLLAHQDTLLTNGAGPQLYRACTIEGTVDFIFGPAHCVFDRCEVRSLARGYLTAPSTPQEAELGYVFYRCHLAGDPAQPTYLGRPWRPYGSTVFVDTAVGAHVQPAGWDNWGNADNERTARFAEYGSHGPGMGGAARVSWARSLPLEAVPAGSALERVLLPLGYRR